MAALTVPRVSSMDKPLKVRLTPTNSSLLDSEFSFQVVSFYILPSCK
jgi:hypothetical protein